MILRLENLARRQRVSESWHRHKELWLSIQLCSTPLWQTYHHRLCLYGSVHHWAPWRKQRMSCNRCDVRDKQLPYCVFFFSFFSKPSSFAPTENVHESLGSLEGPGSGTTSCHCHVACHPVANLLELDTPAFHLPAT